MSELLDTKYNYVFYNVGQDYLEPVFGVLNEYPNVKTYGLAIKSNRIVEKLFFLHWSAKINSKIKLPLKSIWFKKMFDVKFENDKPICYIFYGAKYINEHNGVYKYIKSLNPNNVCIAFYFDLISKRNVDIERLKDHTDYIVSYDKKESKMYGVYYYETVGYGPITEVTTPSVFDYDVYFLGFAKDRLEQIHSTYNYLVNNGLKCKFIICGTKEKDQIQGEGLYYQSPISYIENLTNVNNSKCILDIIQGGSTAPTLRIKEAQVYKRKVLTNNENILSENYYDGDNMSVFSKVENIDLDFLKSDIDYGSFNRRNYYNPYKLIEYFEELLTGGIDE